MLYAVVADGYFVCVATEILNHLLRTSKGALGIYYPLFCKQAFDEDLIVYAFIAQLLHILCPIHFAECFYREQEFIAAQLVLPSSVGIYATTRHYAMQVWMKT